jgi:tetratricopeptide (TPR) repeat protein
MSAKIYTLLLTSLILSLLKGISPEKKPYLLSNKLITSNLNGLCSGNLDAFFRFIDSTEGPAPLFEQMGSHTYKVHTISPKAQSYFDQGLKLIYGFNHGEACRSFKEALKIDPYFAMAHWGIAMALGPNINDWVPSLEREQEAHEALQKGKILARGSEKELAMISALEQRHADSSQVDRDSLNLHYMYAMKALASQYPDDLEIQTLYADAIMNSMPWDYYEKDQSPKPATHTVIGLLEKVIKTNENHPGAHHFYIHIVEASLDPDRGIASADKLGSLIPAAGHLVHMPAHIYARVGQYENAAESNRRAIKADENYLATCQAQGIYPLGYYPHNIHFLWMAATMSGQREEALDAAVKVADKIPLTMAVDDPTAQIFLSVPLQAYVRFGLWNEILTTPQPESKQKLSNMFWRHARSIAFSKKGLLKRAQTEIDSLQALIAQKEIKSDSLAELPKADTAPDMFEDIYQIMVLVPEAELALAKNEPSMAIAKLIAAVALEDGLPYNEPPNWHHPVRQILGNALLKQEEYVEAENIFREDLQKNRDNGWSLFGLQQSLDASGQYLEAKEVSVAFEKAWSHADIKLDGSAF